MDVWVITGIPFGDRTVRVLGVASSYERAIAISTDAYNHLYSDVEITEEFVQ